MLVIIVNNSFELEVPDETITYNLQVNDISELKSRQCNYTNSFSIPKSRANVNFFNQLGFVGDISNFPYEKVNVDLLEDGVLLCRNGWLDIQETAKEYKLNIRDGSIDIFKAIENKTFGDDVDLSEINHQRNVATVIGSFTNDNYRYIVNDYGGKTHLENETKVNIDYLVPSVRYKYLWNKIFSTFGFNYIGDIFDKTDFDDLWVTFPKGIGNLDDNVELYAELSKNFGSGVFFNERLPFPTINVLKGTVDLNRTYIIPETERYKIEAQIFSKGVDYFDKYGFYIFVNGVIQGFWEYGELATKYLSLNEGDSIWVCPGKAGEFFARGGVGFSTTETESNTKSFLRISKINGSVPFSEELKNLKITDFFKETLILFGLTIFLDKDNNYIFKTFDERLKSDVVDWSDKYIERTSETYTPKTYGQKNIFNHKYSKENEQYNDGYFYILNKNIEESKSANSSIFYSSEKDFVNFKLTATHSEVVLPNLLWEKQISENTGNQEIKYKELSNRFQLIRDKRIDISTDFKSELLNQENRADYIPVAYHYFTTYKDFVPKYYNNIKLLLDNFRLHKIKLNLKSIDIHNLDFDKIYYFEQEQNYYFLNKLTYKSGKTTNAEFYRVRKTIAQDIICTVPSLTLIILISPTNFQLNGSWSSDIYLEYSIDGGLNYVRTPTVYPQGSTLNTSELPSGLNFKVRLVAVCDEALISSFLNYEAVIVPTVYQFEFGYGSSSGPGGSIYVCDLPNTGSIFYSLDSVLVIGSKVYVDSALTTPVFGGVIGFPAPWYKSGNKVYKFMGPIDGINEINECS
jgi:hypothetical protein